MFRKVQDWVNSLIVQVMVGTPSAFHSSLQLANRTRSLLLAVATLATFMVGFTPQAQAAPLQMDQSLSGKPNIVLDRIGKNATMVARMSSARST